MSNPASACGRWAQIILYQRCFACSKWCFSKWLNFKKFNYYESIDYNRVNNGSGGYR